MSVGVPSVDRWRQCQIFWELDRDQPLIFCSRTNADGRVAPRSGLAAKHFIDTGAGVIDADYRGEVKVLLFNHSDADFPGKPCIGDNDRSWRQFLADVDSGQ